MRLLETALKNIPVNISQNGQPGATAMLVAPENFFAKNFRVGCVRQFDEGEKNYILERVAALSRQYPNILIIPGTVSWKKPAVPKDLGKLSVEEAGGYEPILHRTSVTPSDMVRDYIEKVNLGEDGEWLALSGQQELENAVSSTLQHGLNRGNGMSEEEYNQNLERLKRTYNDFLHSRLPKGERFDLAYNTAYLFLGGRLKAYHKKSDYYENLCGDANILHVTANGPSVFQIPTGDRNYINLGIEICLDDAYGVLKKFDLEESQKGSILYSQPDIHLVLSAKVKKVSKHICVKQGGSFVHSSSEPTYREGADVLLTLATQKSHAESVTQRRASVPPVTVTPQTTYSARVQNRGNGNECGGCSVM